uniref:Uncharacterized protein n=1 Tax=Gouania willdenowi TaxID=441366 RepID=A0A8C5HV70_GOUWI
MPGTDTGHLTQTTMGLTWKLLCVPTAGDTYETRNTIRRAVSQQPPLSPPINMSLDGATVQLHLHEVGLLLPDWQQAHLDDADDLAVFLHGSEVLLQLLLPLLILPFLAVLGERLLLGLVPAGASGTEKVVLVEAALALVADVLREDGLKGTKATGRVHISNDSNHDHGRSVDLPDDVSHAGLVAQEGGQMDRFGRVIFGETLGLTAVTTASLAGQEAQRPVSGS